MTLEMIGTQSIHPDYSNLHNIRISIYSVYNIQTAWCQVLRASSGAASGHQDKSDRTMRRGRPAGAGGAGARRRGRPPASHSSDWIRA